MSQSPAYSMMIHDMLTPIMQDGLTFFLCQHEATNCLEPVVTEGLSVHSLDAATEGPSPVQVQSTL